VFLRLYKEYKIRIKNASKINTKLGIQKIGLFRIKGRVERNIYKLEIGDRLD
jgi:hypothetical protein